MDNRDFTRWCKSATRLIKLPSDQEAVSRELQHHLEDRYDALIEQGLSPEEATERSLAAMGNPDDIAPQLAAVHKPFWGRAQRLTKYLVWIITVFFMIQSVLPILSDCVTWFTPNNNPYRLGSGDYGTTLTAGMADCSAYSDGRFIEVHNYLLLENADRSKLYLELCFFSLTSSGHDLSAAYFWAVDSNGNYYDPYGHAAYEDSTRIAQTGSMSTSHLLLQDLVIQGYDPTATQWVELHYDRDGRDIVLRIDLTGGGEE